MAQQDDPKHEGLKQAIKAFSFLGGVGIYLVVFVGICGFIGNLADIYLVSATGEN